MPAESKAQRDLMMAALNYKKNGGEASEKVKKIANSMSIKELEKYKHIKDDIEYTDQMIIADMITDDPDIIETVEKSKSGGYEVKTKSATTKHKSKEKAEAQERAIQASKHAKG